MKICSAVRHLQMVLRAGWQSEPRVKAKRIFCDVGGDGISDVHGGKVTEQSTSQWLRAMGAIRPMSVASDQVLVLGKWCDGFYPIQWSMHYDRLSRDFNGVLLHCDPIETWSIFGLRVACGVVVTQADCKRILEQIRVI